MIIRQDDVDEPGGLADLLSRIVSLQEQKLPRRGSKAFEQFRKFIVELMSAYNEKIKEEVFDLDFYNDNYNAEKKESEFKEKPFKKTKHKIQS